MGYPTDDQFEEARRNRTPPSANAEEPAPKVDTKFEPAWPKVVAFLDSTLHENMKLKKIEPIIVDFIALVRADMIERDKIGREKYGVALAAGNGRRHLVDAYQETLDKSVYLIAWLDENGVDPCDANNQHSADDLRLTTNGHAKWAVLHIFATTIEHAITLRGLILGGM